MTRKVTGTGGSARNERGTGMTWEVIRTDEHGNEFVVGSRMTRADAEAWYAKLTARGHKQFYQVRTSDDPCQESA